MSSKFLRKKQSDNQINKHGYRHYAAKQIYPAHYFPLKVSQPEINKPVATKNTAVKSK